MFDYSKSENIGRDIITPLIRVSSAKFPGYYGWGFETWIFSKDPRQKNVQVFSDSEDEAKKKHKHIADNLRKKYIIPQTLDGFVRKLTSPKSERYESCCHHEYKSECPFCNSNIKNSPF